MSITIKITDLQTIVDRVKPSTGTDELLPAFTSVRLYTASGRLCAVATDRYSIMLTRGPKVDGDFDVFIRLSALAKIVATFKKDRKSNGEIRLDHVGDQLVASTGEGVFVDMSDGQLTFELTKETPTPFNKIIEAALAGDGVPAGTGFTAGMLSRVPKIDRNEACEMRGTDKHKPVALIGEEWVLIMMPCRLPDGVRQRGSWTAWFPTEPEKADTKAA